MRGEFANERRVLFGSFATQAFAFFALFVFTMFQKYRVQAICQGFNKWVASVFYRDLMGIITILP